MLQCLQGLDCHSSHIAYRNLASFSQESSGHRPGAGLRSNLAYRATTTIKKNKKNATWLVNTFRKESLFLASTTLMQIALQCIQHLLGPVLRMGARHHYVIGRQQPCSFQVQVLSQEHAGARRKA